MKVNELRIRNWINESVSGIDGLASWEIMRIIEDNPMHSYKPIPLTEEWLLKFGFKPQGITTDGYAHFSDDNIRGNYFCYDTDTEGYDFHVNTGDGWGTTVNPAVSPIKYVHQLQNFYFSLTGTELQIIK